MNPCDVGRIISVLLLTSAQVFAFGLGDVVNAAKTTINTPPSQNVPSNSGTNQPDLQNASPSSDANQPAVAEKPNPQPQRQPHRDLQNTKQTMSAWERLTEQSFRPDRYPDVDNPFKDIAEQDRTKENFIRAINEEFRRQLIAEWKDEISSEQINGIVEGKRAQIEKIAQEYVQREMARRTEEKEKAEYAAAEKQARSAKAWSYLETTIMHPERCNERDSGSFLARIESVLGPVNQLSENIKYTKNSAFGPTVPLYRNITSGVTLLWLRLNETSKKSFPSKLQSTTFNNFPCFLQPGQLGRNSTWYFLTDQYRGESAVSNELFGMRVFFPEGTDPNDVLKSAEGKYGSTFNKSAILESARLPRTPLKLSWVGKLFAYTNDTVGVTVYMSDVSTIKSEKIKKTTPEYFDWLAETGLMTPEEKQSVDAARKMADQYLEIAKASKSPEDMAKAMEYQRKLEGSMAVNQKLEEENYAQANFTPQDLETCKSNLQTSTYIEILDIKRVTQIQNAAKEKQALEEQKKQKAAHDADEKKKAEQKAALEL